MKYLYNKNNKKEKYAYKDKNKDKPRHSEHLQRFLQVTISDPLSLRSKRPSDEVKLICHPIPGTIRKLMDLLDVQPGRLPGLSPRHLLIMTMTMVGRDGTMVVKRINELIIFIVGKATMSPLPALGPPSSGILSSGMEMSGRKATGMTATGEKRQRTRIAPLRQLDVCSLVKGEIAQMRKINEKPSLRHSDRQEILQMTRS